MKHTILLLRLPLLILLSLTSTNAVADDQALAKLVPNAQARRELLNKTLRPLWNFQISSVSKYDGQDKTCSSCHGNAQGMGWGGYKTPNFDFWKSSVFAKFTLNQNRANGLELYQILAKDDVLYPTEMGMPLRSEQYQSTKTDILNDRKPLTKSAVDAALGTQPLYITDDGRCFKHSTLKQDLCTAFLTLFKYIQSSGGLNGDKWKTLVDSAKTMPHGSFEDNSTDPADEGETVTIRSQTVEGNKELLYRLPPNHNISFFTSAAPDNSGVGFSKYTPEAKFYPTVLPLKNMGTPTTMPPLPDVSYDPMFSPDYNLATQTGFMMGLRGGSSDYSKLITFFAPGRFQKSIKQWTITLSGYITIAKIDARKDIFARWKDFDGKYLLMDKRWRWKIFDTVTDSTGRVTDIKIVHPAGPASEAPICDKVDAFKSFNTSDSQISGDARFISLSKARGRVPVVVRTRDCKVVSTTQLDPFYGTKAAFSKDGRFMVFHGYGEDGKQDPKLVASHNEGFIAKFAQTAVANIFIYDIEKDNLQQLTHYVKSNPELHYVALFPTFAGDNQWIYFHRHGKDKPSSEILRMRNPLSD